MSRSLRFFTSVGLSAALALLGACSAAHKTPGTGTPLPMPVPPADSDFDSIAVPPPACVDGWRISLVSHQGSDAQFAMAPDGTMHIMFIGFGGGETELRHVSEAQPQSADTVSPSGLGSLAIAPDGTANAFLSARSGAIQSPDSVGIVRVARGKGGWRVDPTPVSSDGGMANASAIGTDGRAHVAFGDGALYYASADDAGGDGWSRTAIGNMMESSVWSLQLDRNGHPHVFLNGTDGSGATGNFWASDAGGSWQVVSLPASDMVATLDSHGQPHLVVTTTGAGATGGIDHLWYDGSGWKSETLSLGNVTVYDARLDGQDELHLVVGAAPSQLSYAHQVNGAWQVEHMITFDTPMQVPNARLGLDAAGNPHVAFEAAEAGATFGFIQRCD